MTEVVLTERQQFWLEHLRHCEASAEPLTAYAAQHSLSVHSLYEARRRLKSCGVLGDKSAPAPKFVQVGRFQPQRPSGSVCQVRLPNGACVELEVSAHDFDRVLRSVAALT